LCKEALYASKKLAVLAGGDGPKALERGTDLEVGEEPGGILVKVEKRSRTEIPDAALALNQAVELADLAEQRLDGIERSIGCMLHRHP
jgi:hypothetical protein